MPMRPIYSFRRLAAGIVLGAAFLAAAPSSVRSPEDVPKMGGMIRVRDFSVLLKPNLDPAVDSWIFVTQQIFEGLVRLDNKLDLVPALAEYWIVSEDGLKTTFILKRGVRFHHGRELDAQDVKFSFERLLRPETRSPYAALFAPKVVGAAEFREGKADGVSGFKTPEKFVFEVSWKSPYVSAMYLLGMSFCKVLPRDLVTAQGRDFFAKPSGTGAFQFANWVRSPQLDIVGARLERNPRYYGRRAYLDAIEYSPHFTVDHFMDGEVDAMPFLSERLANSGCQVLQGGPYNSTYLLLSCRNAPFDRAAARKAVAAALDKDRLAQTGGGSEYVRRPTANFIPAVLPGFFPLDVPMSADPEAARQGLAELGYPAEKSFPEVRLYYPGPRTEAGLNFVRELQRQLDRVGIPVTTKYFRSLNELHDAKTPYLVLLTWKMDYPDAENVLLPLFGSNSEWNLSSGGYSSPEMDRLLEESATEKSWTRRSDLFRRMEKILFQDMPAVPLYAEEERLAVQSWVRGVRLPPLGFCYIDAKDIWVDRKGPKP